jgi:hypothetical protein
MKICSKCEKKRDLKEFAINAANLDGKDYWCKECRSAYHKIKYPRSMRVMYKDGESKQCRKCEEVKPLTQFPKNGGNKISYCRNCAKSIGILHNLKKMELTPDEYIAMFDAQDGKCYICKNEEPSSNKKRLSVDHDHTCCGKGKACKKCIRKLLCSQCNMALGAVKDNINTLKSAIAYLEEHS